MKKQGSLKLFLCLSFISQEQYYPKKFKVRGSKNLKKGDGEICHEKGGFQRKGRLNHAMHLQENYEMEELYFSLFYYFIHHFSILFKRWLAICLNVFSFEIFFND